MESSRKGPRINIGSVSLTVIFAVLCLTIFAVLSLSTANAERQLAEKTAQAVRNYYEADLACAERAEAVAKILPLDPRQQEEQIRQLGAEVKEDIVSFQEKIDEQQALFVKLRLEEGGFRILAWQAQNVGEWSPEEGIAVWQGN